MLKEKTNNQYSLRIISLLIVFFSFCGCASSLYPVRTAVEAKESIAVYMNKIESRPVLIGNSRNTAKDTIAELDALMPIFKQSLQKELHGAKIVEPKMKNEQILGQNIPVYDFGNIGANIGIEYITATSFSQSIDSTKTWDLTIKVIARFRKIENGRLGQYLGSRLGYTLASFSDKGSCPGACPENANSLVELTNPGQHAKTLKSQIPENVTKVIQEIMKSEP
ncbi:hypothetical protein [Leptospira sp. GIMC2001]|uniref:hypothetical protein n=1 Tax=Leptospira sp. GIMC2001 TaxID=1513297 RepID=UPI00234ABAFA|nr:hypothetical protein [Leptospira sp. GIMC2001]WCL50048.1 hypothetical protein O4O04_04300 [Leptospira sp. GIMC2001]